MRKSGFVILVVLFVLSLQGYAQDEANLPRDIKYVRHSVEYAALCQQVYNSAWPVVKRAALAEDRNWAVILDVDETVLDNSQYAVELARKNTTHNREMWNDWVRREQAPAIHGVKAFLDSVRSLGPKAHIVYLTNRRFFNEEPTISNLQKLGLWQDGDTMLTKKGDDDAKQDRRRCVETGAGRCEKNGPLQIIALFGDNIRDFMPMQGMETATEYRESKLASDPRWGRKFFMLPNPTYGSWTHDYN